MKTKSIFIILATLIIGFIIGFLTNGQLTNNRIQRFVKQGSYDGFKSRLIHVIQPDDAQIMKIEPIIDDYAQRVHQTFTESRKGFKTLHEEMLEKLKPYLEPEQMTRLEEQLRRLGGPWDRHGKPPHADGKGRRRNKR